MTQVIRKPPPDGMFSQSLPVWTPGGSADLTSSHFITQPVYSGIALTGHKYNFPDSMADEQIVELGTTNRGILYALMLRTEGDLNINQNEQLYLYISCRSTSIAQRFGMSALVVLLGRTAFLTPCTYFNEGGDLLTMGAPCIPCPAGLRFFVQAESAIPSSSGLGGLALWAWYAQKDVA